MEDTKLHILMARLSAYELNRFLIFLQSPYHNQNEKLIKLYKALRPYYKVNAQVPPERYRIWKKIYPGRIFTNLQFARLLSDLLKKLEVFLTLEKLKLQQYDHNYHLLDIYTEMKLEKHFTEPYILARSRLDREPIRDSDYYLYSFKFDEQRYTFLENKKLRSKDKNLDEAIESLDSFYLINKLRHCASILHYNQFLNIGSEMRLLPEILENISRNPVTHIPVAHAYYLVILTITEPDREEHFMEMKKLFSDNLHVMEVHTRRDIFNFALNYCIRKVNQGVTRYQTELLGLYKEALAKDLIYEQGILSPWDYKNIITIGLRAGDLAWTDEFIENYNGKLSKDQRTNAYTFNRARYFFAIRKYDKVLQLLQSVEYSDVFYLLDSKTTLMKTYYELGEYQSLLSLRQSFRMLLDRKKTISDQNRINYSNFSRFIVKLFRIDVKDTARLASLKSQIESTGNVADRGWILEKLYELIPKT